MSATASTSNFHTSIVSETTFAYLDLVSHYLNPNRPWLTLYNRKLRWTPKSNVQLSSIQQLIPEELMLMLFRALDPYTLGRAACVCHQWRLLVEHPSFWQSACSEAFRLTSDEENLKILKLQYGSSWKRMFMERPHLRFDGIYIARNTYLRRGVIEWKNKKPVHIVKYFRYIRFFPNGQLYYYTSPMIPSKVGPQLRSKVIEKKKGTQASWQGIQKGTYTFHGDKILCVLKYASVTICTEVKIVLQLKSTCQGANNCLDVGVILTRDEGIRQYIVTMPDQHGIGEDETLPNDEVQEHRRGNASFVFITWDKIETCYLNDNDW